MRIVVDIYGARDGVEADTTCGTVYGLTEDFQKEIKKLANHRY